MLWDACSVKLRIFGAKKTVARFNPGHCLQYTFGTLLLLLGYTRPLLA